MTEEDTAELSKWAAEEASRCLDSDGKVVVRRLRTVLLGGRRHFLRQLLGRLPSAELLALKTSGNLGVPAPDLEDLLSGDVINSAFLAEHGRARSAWLRRPVPATEGNSAEPGAEAACPPPPIGVNLTGIKVPIFDDAGTLTRAVVPRALDHDERQHPAVEAKRGPGGRLCLVPSVGAFRALLSAFTHGLSEHIPWGSGVVLGGSACLACLAIPEKLLRIWRVDLERAASLWSAEEGTSHRALVAALGHGAGCNAVASLITAFAFPRQPRQEARRLLEPLAKQLFGVSSPYASSDLDLFFFAPSKAEGARALEETKKRLVVAMAKKGSEPPCTVRTPNSVTLCGRYPLRHTQLVCKLAEDISEILAFVDMHCTAFLYDGRQVWGTPLAIRSLEVGYNFISNKQFTATADVARRAAKYAQRGCGTLIYELCRHTPRCDVEVDDKVQRQLELARSLAQRPSRGPTWVQQKRTGVVAVDGYDEVHLPHGSPADVEAYVKNQHRMQGDFSMGRVVTCSGEVGWWAPMVEWRRDRGPQLRRKFGLESGETAHCYMCGGHAPTGEVKPMESQGMHLDKVDSQPSGHAVAASSDGTAAGPSQRRVPLCTRCVRLNAQRSADRENLSGFTAVVTGGRCKVGYEACLTLLRCGAFVVTCTRFPRCAARRFLKESDAAEWSGRLHIYGVDFSDFPSLQAFASQLVGYYTVDALVNNAAQTIRRPPAYYRELFEEEKGAYTNGLGISVPGLAAEGPVRSLGSDPWAADVRPPSAGAVQDLAAKDAVALAAQAVGSAPLRSAAQALVPRLPGDAEGLAFFPSDRLDLHGEPIDLRPQTSWTTSLAAREGAGSIAPRELLEVLAVNAAAPFVLLQQLIPVLTRPGGSLGRFVVNVTSAEGVFSSDGASAKSAEHPHSNMAKAALNMLTKTAAAELAGQGVYCTAVDPGWISMMRPGEPTLRGRPLPPLSEADGAARVLAPVLDGVRALREGREPQHGVLLRNFEPVAW